MCAEWVGCEGFNPDRDIVAPGHDVPNMPPLFNGRMHSTVSAPTWHQPLLQALHTKGTAAALAVARKMIEAKPLSLFFTGSFRFPGQEGNMQYSLGVRQALQVWMADFKSAHCPEQGNSTKLGSDAAKGMELPSPVLADGSAKPQQQRYLEEQEFNLKVAVKHACMGALVVEHLERDGYDVGRPYMAALDGSKVCIAPPGWGWGMRLVTYAAHGCIPLIIQDAVPQPFEELLPYDQFSLRATKADIASGAMWRMVSGLSKERLAQLLLGLAQHRGALMWQPEHGGSAYEHTLELLRRRVEQLRASGKVQGTRL
uniref:Exostosin GT47 domain-containing protein n=1 Tax=Chlamydomonas leiostraca TaxID=1034604 RepID=A0A7S0R4X8_9CHLO